MMTSEKMDKTIPKVIHYCWFGKNPLPELAIKCINSWKKYFPEYEIKEWNESNFDIMCCSYVKEAYKARKWAFVSDYARFWILYHKGGLYFDTDVEVIKSFEDILSKGSFMGCEPTRTGKSKCAPGLGLGAKAGLSLYKEVLDYYEKIHFIKEDNLLNPVTVVTCVTNILCRYGFKGNGKIEKIKGITIYPVEYFCPLNYNTGIMNIVENTHSIHHYVASWHTKDEIRCHKIVQMLNARVGKWAGRLYSLQYKARLIYKKQGILRLFKFTLKKFLGGGYKQLVISVYANYFCDNLKNCFAKRIGGII